MKTDAIQARRDIAAYRLAREYLLTFPEVNEGMLVKYFVPVDAEAVTSMEGIFRRLVVSAQNANMKASVVGGAIGGIDALAPVLCGFAPQRVLDKYGKDDKRLLDNIVAKVKPHGQIRRTPRSIWPQFCQAVLSGSAFLSQFASAADFCSWVTFFDKDDRARASLPMLLAKEIHGIGFALACDFLKEMGFQDFCKPDVHLKNILAALGLSDSGDDYAVFKAIVRIAKSNGKKPYEVDKLFWLIGSGRFYDDDIKIGRHAEEFIEYAGRRIDEVTQD